LETERLTIGDIIVIGERVRTLPRGGKVVDHVDQFIACCSVGHRTSGEEHPIRFGVGRLPTI